MATHLATNFTTCMKGREPLRTGAVVSKLPNALQTSSSSERAEAETNCKQKDKLQVHLPEQSLYPQAVATDIKTISGSSPIAVASDARDSCGQPLPCGDQESRCRGP
eukprot:CAMPEP_0172750480 /NCGR_PEP_ID=MMETSP1074-20121228/149706_1 /TAXON_ID=2916 /ORGANISM="Ceratium fusus, Strain PA161109" /LENGTH=106 /DNA_ID=CAMNT_0013582625 /DNA_START=228 /DNA_END=545 /DNA_ORIENTATION=+